MRGGVLVSGRGSRCAPPAFVNTLDGAIANVTLITTPALITRIRQNSDEIRAHGVEIETDLRIHPTLTINAQTTFTSSQFRGSVATPALAGNRVPQVPSVQFGGGITWTPELFVTVGAGPRQRQPVRRRSQHAGVRAQAVWRARPSLAGSSCDRCRASWRSRTCSTRTTTPAARRCGPSAVHEPSAPESESPCHDAGTDVARILGYLCSGEPDDFFLFASRMLTMMHTVFKQSRVRVMLAAAVACWVGTFAGIASVSAGGQRPPMTASLHRGAGQSRRGDLRAVRRSMGQAITPAIFPKKWTGKPLHELFDRSRPRCRSTIPVAQAAAIADVIAYFLELNNCRPDRKNSRAAPTC